MKEGFLEPAEEMKTRSEGSGRAHAVDRLRPHFSELMTILIDLHLLVFEIWESETAMKFHASEFLSYLV